jgi:Spy/CpxP family protein refolding chaperone
MDDRRTIAWFSAFVIVVLLVGIASGILLDRFLIRGPGGGVGRGGAQGPGMQQRMPARGMRQGPGGPGPGAGPMRPGLEERLAQELELTGAQKDQVKAILERRRTRLDEVRTETQKRMEKEQEELRSEIRGVLTEAQKKKFDEVMANAPGFGGRGMGERGMRRGGMR